MNMIFCLNEVSWPTTILGKISIDWRWNFWENSDVIHSAKTTWLSFSPISISLDDERPNLHNCGWARKLPRRIFVTIVNRHQLFPSKSLNRYDCKIALPLLLKLKQAQLSKKWLIAVKNFYIVKKIIVTCLCRRRKLNEISKKVSPR